MVVKDAFDSGYNTLRLVLDDCDRGCVGKPNSFFPITTKLRREGFAVLYYGYDPDLKESHEELFMGLSDSYVVTKRTSGPEKGKLECWVLPITGQDWLHKFQKREALVLSPDACVTLWGLPVEPSEFPTAQYINQGLATEQVSVDGGVARRARGVSLLSKDDNDTFWLPVDGARQVPEAALFHPFATVLSADDDKVAKLEAKLEELDNDLNLAESTSCAMFDDLQDARRELHETHRKLSAKNAAYAHLEGTFHKLRTQSLDRAQTIIKMVDVAEIRKKATTWEVSQLATCQQLVLTQNSEVRELTDELEKAHFANSILNEANERLKKRLDVARQGGKQDFEVDATKVIALSSFKMSTVSTAIRWICTAATVGSVVYLLG